MAEHPFTTDPVLAQRVAQYIAGCSILELCLTGIFAAATKDAGSLTHLVLHRASLSERVNLIADLGGILPDDDEMKAMIAESMPELRHCIAYRNKLAHGIYTQNEAGVNLICSFVSSRKNTSTDAISVNILDLELERLRALNAKLMAKGFAAAGIINIPQTKTR